RMRKRSVLLPLFVLLSMVLAQIGPAGAATASQAPPADAPALQVPPSQRHAPHDKEREGDVDMREDWFYGQRAAPGTHVPPGALPRAREQLETRLRSGAIPRAAQGPSAPLAVTESVWSAIGPQPI